MQFVTLRCSTITRRFASLLNGAVWTRVGVILVLGFALLGLSTGPTQAQDAPFITVWNTEKSGQTGETADDQIKIPGTGTDYQIIWEEIGNTSNTDTLTATDDVTITFPNPGD